MRTTRRVKRNIERAIAGRTFNEKRMKQTVFQKGIETGARLMKDFILSRTSNLTYEDEPNGDTTQDTVPQVVEEITSPISSSVPDAAPVDLVPGDDPRYTDPRAGVDAFGGSDFPQV